MTALFSDALRALGHSDNMSCSLVNRFQYRGKRFSDIRLALAAPESPSFFEIGLSKTANRAASGDAPFFNFLGRADAEQQIRQRETSWVLHAFFFRTRVAKIHLLHLPLNNLSQEDRCVI